MKKNVLGVLLFTLFMGSATISNAENNDQMESVSPVSKAVENKNNQEKTLESKFDSILSEIKKQNINEEDFIEYSRSIKEKLSVNVVNYFNEIENNLDILTENKNKLSENLVTKIDELRNSMADSVKKYNEETEGFDLRKEFESVSNQYIEIIKEYKSEVENKVKN